MRTSCAFWQAPHRPLFLLAALSAFVVPLVWLAPHRVGPDAVAWHSHELAFGMGGAAVGGYLLTSLPSWTQQGPVAPRLTMAVCALWVLSRLSFFWAGLLPYAVLMVGTQAYLVTLAGLLIWKIAVLRIWSRAWLVLAMGVLISSDLFFLFQAYRHAVPPDGAAVIVLSFAVLLSLVGGRAVPAFTRSWLERQRVRMSVRDSSVLSVFATVSLAAGGLLMVVARDPVAGGVFILSGALHLLRTAGWKTWEVRRYPALLLLHLSWIWLPAGLFLVGLAMIRPEWIALSDAIHALAMGAMGATILAIMARAIMVRRGDMLLLGKPLALAFALVWISAFVRVSAPFAPSLTPDPIRVSAILWMAGWLIFLFVYVPRLCGPIPRPILSARVRR
ncbi:short-chain dehydrogenase [Hyphomicrobium nitrativorans NL23]|uniref:Short-chain dehydrogenase n=1 Tax=Hyphomicrobium nitrativorans NL23 TaxID=1029756 RepID=V5SC66_9HYPH|nr:NnrS family protein [Hyphomicrobium nitrativorans]AHB48077.1 short-chain dehydrogenase [Hyphomicrobium nitrativorans NL23]